MLSDEFQVGSEGWIADYGEAMGYTVKVLTANNNATTQLSQMDDAIGQNPVAIILNAVDANVVSSGVAKATAAGILVEAYDRLMPDAKVDFSATGDIERIGEMAGERALKYLRGKYGSEKGVVLEVMGDPGDFNAVYLDQGFTKVLSQYPNIELIRKEAAGWEGTVAASIIDDQLTVRGTEIDLMFPANDAWMPAVTSVLQKHGYTAGDPRLYLIAQGGTPTGLEGIRSGWLQETVDYAISPEYKTMFDYLDQLKAKTPIAAGTVSIDGFNCEIKITNSGPTLYTPGEVITKAGGDGTIGVDDPSLWGNVKITN